MADLDFAPPIRTPSKPLKDMKRQEIENEVLQWRKLWSWIPEDTKTILTKIGTEVAITTRWGKRYVGTLGQPKFDMKEIQLEVFQSEYNYEQGKEFMEHKTIHVPMSALIQLDIIHGTYEKEKATLPEPNADQYVSEKMGLESEVKEYGKKS